MKKKTDYLLLAAGVIFLIMFCVSGVKLWQYYNDTKEQKEMSANIATLREQDLERRAESVNESAGGSSGQAAEDMYVGLQRGNSLLADINPDYVGWITIPETEIYYPVVQRDNSHYLSHDFYDKRNSHGTIFLDENRQVTDDVILLHGHHMKDGTMFAALKGYKKKDFRTAHPYLYLDFGSGDIEYRVFATALVDLTQEGYFSYDKFPNTEEEKKQYLNQLKANAFWYETPEDTSGQIVLLSTCDYGSDEQRLVVAAIAEKQSRNN